MASQILGEKNRGALDCLLDRIFLMGDPLSCQLLKVLPRASLMVSIDEPLELKTAKKTARGKQTDSRLLHRMQQIEKLSTNRKRLVMQVIDAFVEAEQLKQRKA